MVTTDSTDMQRMRCTIFSCIIICGACIMRALSRDSLRLDRPLYGLLLYHNATLQPARTLHSIIYQNIQHSPLSLRRLHPYRASLSRFNSTHINPTVPSLYHDFMIILDSITTRSGWVEIWSTLAGLANPPGYRRVGPTLWQYE